MTLRTIAKLTLIAAAAAGLSAQAAVSADEAAKLKTTLTPLGAEKAANKEGTIPAWTGGFTGQIPGDVKGGKRGDPFKGEKPLYSVTAANMAQHADKLTAGVQAMLKKYPQSYRLDVYPTHRTALAPAWVYENTFKNATRAKLEGDVVTGAYGGIPFPIPKSGAEAMWNHTLLWRGPSWEASFNQYQITADGRMVLTTSGNSKYNMPYYYEGGSPENYSGYYWQINLVNDGPPVRAGEMIVGRENLDPSKTAAYVYLAGQRRVRKLPNACCDTPTPASAGLMSFDEISVWNGRTNLFDWKLVGKKEMLVPYHQNKLLQVKDAEAIKGQHLNPDHIRWELHRVWEVEANLKPGARHQAPKARYYLDEDTWQAVLGDRWDANGQLWKTTWNLNYVMPDIPGTVQQTFGFYDLISGVAYVSNLLGEKSFQHRPTARWPEQIFTGEGLASQGVR